MHDKFVTMNAAFWDATPCNLVNMDRGFCGKICSLPLRGYTQQVRMKGTADDGILSKSTVVIFVAPRLNRKLNIVDVLRLWKYTNKCPFLIGKTKKNITRDQRKIHVCHCKTYPQ